MTHDAVSTTEAAGPRAREPNVVATLHFPRAGEPHYWPTSTPSPLGREIVNLLAEMFELEAGLANAAGLAAAVYREDGRWYSHLPGTADLLNRFFGPKARYTSFPALPPDAPRVAQAVAELFGARITWANRPGAQRVPS